MKNFLIFSSLLLCCAAAFVKPSFSEQTNPAVKDVFTVYNELMSQEYKPEFDDPITVTGIVTETGISIYATPYINLSNEKNGTVYATCVLPRTDALKLKEFKKGEKVILQGNFYAFRDKAVIKKCKKIEMPDNDSRQ